MPKLLNGKDPAEIFLLALRWDEKLFLQEDNRCECKHLMQLHRPIDNGLQFLCPILGCQCVCFLGDMKP